MSDKKPRKNIVICCDGTGNQFGLENSNVVKLYACLKVDKEQLAYYHPGVGTMGAQNRPSRLGQLTSQIAGLAFGGGFQDNLGDAYRFLMQHYEDGDRVFLFGFSRGAYTVRALAGMLYVYGLLCPGNEGHIPYVLRNYSRDSRDAYNREETGISTASAFKQTFSRDIDIHFVGVWDTVSTIGWVYDPVKLLFDGQNPIIRTGRHAVSIDERRCYFQANLWGNPLFVERPEGDSYQQDIVQAWFAGVHSDVGGSYKQDQSFPAYQALIWILDEAIRAELQIDESRRATVFGAQISEFESLQALYKQPDPFNKLHNSLTWKWWFPEVLPHVYFDGKGKKRLHFEPWPHRRELPPGALLHPSVLERRNTVGYEPKNIDFRSVHSYGDAPPELLEKDCVVNRSDLSAFSVYAPKNTEGTTSPSKKLAATAAVAAISVGAAWVIFRK